MAKAMKKRDRYVFGRDSDTGRYLDVKVADPPVKPKGVSVTRISEAVRKSGETPARKHK